MLKIGWVLFFFLGIIGMAYLVLGGGLTWIFALVGWVIILYFWMVIAREVTGDDDWTPWPDWMNIGAG